MTVTTYVFGIVAPAIIIIVVIELLRRRRLRERHAMWWLIAGTFALVAGIFPQTLEWASSIVGIEIPVNLVFFVAIAVLFFVGLQHSAELTRLESKTRVLAERVALLEMNANNYRAEVAQREEP